MNKTSLGDRMKIYENCYRQHLPENLPVVVRLDGVCGHTFTHGFKKPFDEVFMECMQNTAMYLAKNISGCKFAYTQSDEISLLLTNNDTRDTQPWFDNNINKLVSVSASMATMSFNRFYQQKVCELSNHTTIDKNNVHSFNCYFDKDGNFKQLMFDSRAWVLPEHEVVNYMLWRQNDCTRNSIQSVAQSMFSQKELHGLKCSQLQDKMFTEKNVNWNDYPTYQKRGTCVIKRDALFASKDKNEKDIAIVRPTWTFDFECPIFSQNKDYIQKTFKI